MKYTILNPQNMPLERIILIGIYIYNLNGRTTGTLYVPVVLRLRKVSC